MRSRTTIQTLFGSILLVVSMLLFGFMVANMDAFDDEISYSMVFLGVIIIGCFIAGFILVLPADFKRKIAKRDVEKRDADRLDKLEEIKSYAWKAKALDPKYMPPWEGRKIDYVVIAHSSERIKTGSAVLRGVVGGAIGTAASTVTGGLAAPIGAAAGIMGAKRKGYLDLIIHYKNGKAKTQRVKVNSGEYRRLAPFIRA